MNQAQLYCSKLIIKVKNKLLFIEKNDIFFIEKQDKKILIHCEDRTYEVTQTLESIASYLDEHFLRLHKSFIVNVKKINIIIEVAPRSYEIIFNKYDKKALMSRYQYKKYKHLFLPYW